MSYLKQKFIDYMYKKGNVQPGGYCNGLDNVEKLFSVDIDKEYDKDQCESLYKRIQATRKNPEPIGKNEHTVRQYASNVKKYIEFRQNQNSYDNKFAWIPFYEEFADKLLKYKNNRQALISLIKKIYADIEMKLPKLDYDEPIDIDPFTVFGLFNKGITTSNRIKISTAFKSEFGVASNVPSEFLGVPVVNNLSATFYYFVGDREEHDIDNLWELFEMALQYSVSNTKESKEKVISAYDKVIKQKGAAWNITMGLYWIRPYSYINLDSYSRKAFNALKMIPPIDYNIIPLIKTLPSGNDYFNIIDICKEVFANHNLDFPTLSYNAWEYNKQNGRETEEYTDTGWWPSLEYFNPNISKENWKKYILDVEKPNHSTSMQMLKAMLELGGEASCKKLSDTYGGTPSRYVGGAVNLGKRVKEYFNLPSCIDDNQERYFPFEIVK